jgi:hypothetical protein
MHQTQGHPYTQKKKKTVMDIKAQVGSNTVIVEDLNTPWSPISRSSDKRSTKKLQSFSTY